MPPADPPFRLLAVSDRHGLAALGLDLAGWCDHLAAAGVDAVQLREKDLDDRTLLRWAARMRARLPAQCRLLINGRLDVALAASADGVHLPSRGLPAGPLRARFGREVLLGRSTHHPSEVAAAAREGADYVTFGPAFATPSKAGCDPPAGLQGLSRAAAAAAIPVYAIGGITLQRFAEVAAAGAAGIAAIRLFQQLPELAATVERARASFAGAAGPALGQRGTEACERLS